MKIQILVGVVSALAFIAFMISTYGFASAVYMVGVLAAMIAVGKVA